jgi:hypothetical protein
LVGLGEILLTLWLVPHHGYLVMAAILAGYLAISIGITAWRGWREIRTQETHDLMQVGMAVKDLE